jgi:hypothetical protein
MGYMTTISFVNNCGKKCKSLMASYRHWTFLNSKSFSKCADNIIESWPILLLIIADLMRCHEEFIISL